MVLEQAPLIKKGGRTLLSPRFTAPFCDTTLAGGLVNIPTNFLNKL